jgi:penicillin-binding protein 1A
MSVKKRKSDIRKKRVRREKRGFFKTFVLGALLLVVILAVCSAVASMAVYYRISKDLPKIVSLADYDPSIITTVYASDNRKIAEFFKERRIVIPLSDMPQMLLDAFVAAEDSRFYKHRGIDFISIIRAFFKNLEAGTIVQGGSTITQQVTKSFLLTPERSYKRKLKEAILAYRIDKAFSKKDILFL